MSRKTKQDRIIDLLGAICEKLDALLAAQNRTWPSIPIAPMPEAPPWTYPKIVMYGCPGQYPSTSGGTGDAPKA